MLPVARRVALVLMLFVVGAGCLGGDCSWAEDRRTERRKGVMLELVSKQQRKVVIFSNPVAEVRSGDPETPWTLLAIQNYGGGDRVVVEDLSQSEGSAVFPHPDVDQRWSPDGRYLVVVRAANVTSEGSMGAQTFEFIDVVESSRVGFSGDGVIATTDNFFGWSSGKPHAMLLWKGKGTVEASPED